MHFYVSCATARKQKKKLLKHQRVLTYSYCPKQYMDSFFTERCNYLSVKKSKKKVMLLDVTHRLQISVGRAVSRLWKNSVYPISNQPVQGFAHFPLCFERKKKKKKIFLKCSSETKKKRWMFRCRQTPVEIRDG